MKKPRPGCTDYTEYDKAAEKRAEETKRLKEMTAQLIAEIMVSPIALKRLAGPDK